ncbi:MAG TPA: class I SAM-dependent rRNA methyltransferase [Clostridia bacterium]|nr:class I SAM-dependent rRNA methyltransferase [Clostridia bacterium]
MKRSADNPQVTITPRAVSRVHGGHPWVYRSDIKSGAEAAPGSLVTVVDHRGKPLGTALYSSTSQIALRMLNANGVSDLPSLVRERISAAVAYRREVVRDSDAYRVVFSEADQLPGLIADRYNDVVTFQVLTQAMDPEPVRAAIIDTLRDELRPAAIVERVDPRIRELESLSPRESSIAYPADEGATKTSTVFSLNGVQFQYDALGGQKTGAFLDQRQNYAAAERYARGRALDICTYQGGFALHLNRVCDSVTGVDVSRAALEVADANLALNGGREIEWIEANAFELLKDYSAAGEQYDTIVLDPPAFAKTKSKREDALRGYKELNLRALKMLKPGGVLVTCSCSYHVGESDFLEMLSGAAVDAHRTIRVIEKRTQSQDHPILLSVPETYYLKCVICSVL